MSVFTEPVIVSAFAGLCVQLLSLLELSKVPKAERPDFNDFIYWLPYIVGPIIGGLFGYGYFHDHPPDSFILSIHIGASAPLVLRTMASVVPKNVDV